MPKPTVQNTPKPEPKRPARPAVKVQAPLDALDREAVFALLIPHLEDGLSLNESCAKVGGVRPGNVLRWVREDAALAEHYARARELGYLLQADRLAETAKEIVPTLENGATDSGYVADKRLRVDTQKWILAKMLPKIYGDKVTQELTGANGGAIQIASVNVKNLTDQELAQMETLLLKVNQP